MRSNFDPAKAGVSFVREAGSLALQSVMYGFGFVPSQHTSVRSGALHTVVFVHGLAANRASLYPLQAYLGWHGYRRQFNVSYLTTGSIEACALQLKRRIDAEVKGGRIDLVCHSMGGLVARFYLQQLDGARRVSRVVTLATPHMGTHATAWMPLPLVQQMAPKSPFLQHLNGLPEPEGVDFSSIGAGADVLVLPPENARAPFGAYAQFDQLGHTGLMLSPNVLRAVHEALGPCEESFVSESSM
jgi:triacylglycerol lipase